MDRLTALAQNTERRLYALAQAQSGLSKQLSASRPAVAAAKKHEDAWRANRDPATRAIVFTGTGRAFCAGDDRHEHVHPANEAEARALVDAIQRATRAIVFGEVEQDGPAAALVVLLDALADRHQHTASRQP